MLPIGSELDDRYQVVAELGHGGMGQVYLVKHLQSGRQEALKVLRPELAASPESVSRLRREARAVNRLHHPNIITMYDFGRLPDGRYYLTMEFAEGESLAKALKREGPPPVERTVDLLKQACRALDHAHKRGVVHRDLKPDNLVLADHRGAPVLKVLDFGLAKILDTLERESHITPQGSIYGTPSYMAPEQLQSDAHDERTDLYSLGCVAFELLTGQRPFHGRTIQLVTAHLTTEPPRPSELCPDKPIPPELEALVLRCLAKRPEDRPPSAKHVLAALEAILPKPLTRKMTRHPTYAWYLAGNETTVPTLHFEVADAENPDDQLDGEREALRDAAEILLDGGCNEVALFLAVAEVETLDREEATYNQELDALALQTRQFEQRIQAQEASLRFQIAEFRLARLSCTNEQNKRLDAKIQALSAGLTDTLTLRDDELRRISDREVEIISALHARELRVEQAYTDLADAIRQALSGCGTNHALEARDRFAQAPSFHGLW